MSEPDPVDVEVGRRLRRRREEVGMSQTRLGELLGVTFQQVQKYERGGNRVSSSRLRQACASLQVPISYFFDDGVEGVPSPDGRRGLAEAPAGFVGEEAAEPAVGPAETIPLVEAFARIADPTVRRRIYDLVRTLADNATGHPRG